MKRLVLENKAGILNQIHSYIEKNSEAKYIHRLQVILLFANKEDESCDSLGLLFGNSPRSISTWIKRINQTGAIDSLRSKPQSGRPSRLTKVQQNEIKMVLRELSEKSGIKCKKWNGRNLSSYISQRYGISLQVRACQRLLQELFHSHDISN
jgi:transposase